VKHSLVGSTSTLSTDVWLPLAQIWVPPSHLSLSATAVINGECVDTTELQRYREWLSNLYATTREFDLVARAGRTSRESWLHGQIIISKTETLCKSWDRNDLTAVLSTAGDIFSLLSEGPQKNRLEYAISAHPAMQHDKNAWMLLLAPIFPSIVPWSPAQNICNQALPKSSPAVTWNTLGLVTATPIPCVLSQCADGGCSLVRLVMRVMLGAPHLMGGDSGVRHVKITRTLCSSDGVADITARSIWRNSVVLLEGAPDGPAVRMKRRPLSSVYGKNRTLVVRGKCTLSGPQLPLMVALV
jgi:hypothetical protein